MVKGRSSSRLGELKALYLECFSDSEACTDVLFSSLLGEKNARTLEENGKILSALYVTDKKLSYCGKVYPLPFFVGISTAKKARGRGLAKKLISDTLRSFDTPFAFLHPAITGFYEQLDFATVSYDPIGEKPPSGEFLAGTEMYSAYQNAIKKWDFYIEKPLSDFELHIAADAADSDGFRRIINENSEKAGFTDGLELLLPDAEGKIPGAMARLASLEKAAAMIGDLPLSIKLTDSVIEKNNLIFTIKDGRLVPCSKFDVEMTAGEFTRSVFGYGPYALPVSGYIYDKY